MKNTICFIALSILLFACSKSDVVPVVSKPAKQYSDKDLFGSWKLENNGVTINFDIVSDPYYKTSDTIYVRHVAIMYQNVTSTPPDTAANKSSAFKIKKVNGVYNITFTSEVNNGNNTGANTTQLYSCKVNSDYTQLSPAAGNYPDGSWTSLVGYVDTNFLVVNFSPSAIITKSK